MKNPKILLLVLAGFALSVLYSPLSRAEDAPAPAPSGEELSLQEITATVADINHETRVVTLKGPEGNTLTFKVDDDVPNLNKVKKGDKVDVMYYQTLAWDLVKTKAIPEPAKTVTTTVYTATINKKPMKIEMDKVQLYAKLTHIDKANDMVTLQGPEGKSVTLKVKNPANLEGVKTGDLVEVHYTEAVAAAVKKK